MNLLRRLLLRLRAVFGRRALESDMQAEMHDHLERAAERLVARGMSPAAARLEARREFGNVGVLQEEAREARGARWLDALASDLSFAFRYFARNKATTAIIVAVLALGIGANTLMFSMFQAEMMRPPPAVPKDDAHVRIHAMQREARGRWQASAFSHPELVALRARSETFRDVAGHIAHDVVLDAGDSTGARGVGAQFVTPNFFHVLGIPLAAGPGFTFASRNAGARDETGDADMAAVISFAVAEELYGTPPAAVGKRVLVNQIPVRVVGVALPGFQGALRNRDSPALWIPLSARAQIARVPYTWHTDGPALDLFARLAPDASPDQADVIARQVAARALPDSAARLGTARTASVRGMHRPAPGDETAQMYLVSVWFGVIGLLILLLVCTNVSSLMVASAVRRRHEIAVRFSLGATRVRVLRQLLTESTMLALAAGASAMLLSWWLITWLNRDGEIDGVNVMPDLGTIGFTMALALGTGMLFGLSPALHATRGHVANALRDSGTGATRRSRLQRVFVVAQIVISQPLLLLLGVTSSMIFADFEPLPSALSQRVVRVSLRPLTRTGTPAQRQEAVDSLVPRIAAHAEVTGAVPEAAAFAVRSILVPDDDASAARAETVELRARVQWRARSPSVATTVHVEGAVPGWFALLDVPILMGRDVAFADTAERDWPVVIGSDLARTLWRGENPIGRTLASPASGSAQDSIAMTVVGVYDATRQTTRGKSVDRVYTARDKRWRRDVVLVRTRGAAEPFLPELRRVIRAAAPGIPVGRMETLAHVAAAERRESIQVVGLAGTAGVLVLLLACLGLYGVVSLAVRQRKREIGIRIALGAKPAQVVGMFLASGVWLAVVGLLLGLPVSTIGMRVLLMQPFVIAPPINAWLVGGAVGLMLLAVATAATWLPARRAAFVDPALTLRIE